ncbi:MAG: ABC transporter permease [Phycisphaeraceae bacterium]|nr:ABC transporter permease [Phycisphaeraceae bacterium]
MIILRVLIQTVFLAVSQIWANKVRALLTTLGIIIGVAAVIGTVSATDGLKRFVLKEFETFGTKKVYIDGWMPRSKRGRGIPWWKSELVMAEVDAIVKHTTTIDKFTPLFFGSYDLAYNDQLLKSIQVTGIWPQWHDIESRYVTQGRRFTSIDEEQRLSVCLVNDKAIELLTLDREPVGESILIGGRRFKVVGVVETKTISPMFGGGEAEAEVYIPLSMAMSLNPGRRHVNFLLGELSSPDKAEEAKAEVGFMLRRMRNLPPGEEDNFRVQVLQQFIDQFNKVATAITAGAGGIVAISLLVGGIGIMNIMLVSVSERTREIGLRKAMGARPAVILMQFLVEAVVLCLAGAGIGLLVGEGLTLAMTKLPGSPLENAVVPFWAIVLSVGFSVVTGVLFGMFPAIKAARLDPIAALRHE